MADANMGASRPIVTKEEATRVRESSLSVERVRDLLCYDPSTGVFTWRYHRPKCPAGGIAGSITPRGYWRIKLDGEHFMAHRVAWAIFYGEWPQSHVDHVNCVRSDNRISNLRLASCSNNQHNRGKAAHNTSGLKGAYWDKSRGKWLAMIGVNGRYKHLGRYETAEQAHDAYCMAARELHGDFARTE